MKERISILPNWCITNLRPAVYDAESKTVIEQTARIYAAMKELQEDYNKFSSELESTVNMFILDTNTDQDKFKAEITKIVHDYIAMLDAKVAGMTDDYVTAVEGVLEEEIASLTVDVNARLAAQDSRIAELPSELRALIDTEVAEAFESEVADAIRGEY